MNNGCDLAPWVGMRATEIESDLEEVRETMDENFHNGMNILSYYESLGEYKWSPLLFGFRWCEIAEELEDAKRFEPQKYHGRINVESYLKFRLDTSFHFRFGKDPDVSPRMWVFHLCNGHMSKAITSGEYKKQKKLRTTGRSE